jgi:Domain of unknown function (DUF4262)
LAGCGEPHRPRLFCEQFARRFPASDYGSAMLNDYHKHLLDIIDEHGWAVQSVGGDRLAGDAPFTYTVGLTAFGHPELVMTGAPPRFAASVLNSLGSAVRDGHVYQANTMTSDVTGAEPTVALIEVIDPASHLYMAVDLYQKIEALQIIWRDSRGRLPWDDDYENSSDTQPFWGIVPDSFD